jgi:tetratricopeptide (TPR) repeat protein
MNAPLLQQAISLYQTGQADKAASICRNVLQRQPGQPDALHILGNIAKDQGRLQEALQHFQQALRVAPGHVHLLNSAGLLFRKMGYLQQAQACFEQAIKIDPNYYQGRYNLANLCRAQGDTERAKQLYRQVLKQRGSYADALANLSSVLEEEHRLDEAEPLARKAVELDPENYIARVTLAKLAKRKQQHDEVLGHVGPLLEKSRLSPVNFAVAAGLLAQAQQGLGNYSQAFELYQRANDVLFETHVGTMQGLRSMYAPESLQTLHEFFADGTPIEQSETLVDQKSPVFLVGFPRSGTTLLDQILSSHSRIVVLEEKENLEDFYMRFPATPDRLAELMACPAEQLQGWRDTYWGRIRDEIDLSDDRVVVDKLPLNTILLPYIRRLFPAAKIIFALRDPRDAVFSCFQQRFGMNQAMFQFLKLETAVSYYDQVMSLARLYKDRLSIPMHLTRYESLITDFDSQLKGVLDFLGLPWEDRVRDYQSTARQRRISTPSAQDVTRPLYTTSIGKWQHYRGQIGGHFEPLRKWVEYWGYESPK